MRLFGPFSQVLTMEGLAPRGPLQDEDLRIIQQGGVLVEDASILAVGSYQELRTSYPSAKLDTQGQGGVLLPGLVDAHTHILFDGSRAADYALRNAGVSYQEIARQGGGIWHTVQATRAASSERLAQLCAQRAHHMTTRGCTTIEVKSGYGLSVEHELRMLRAIALANETASAQLIPTCLAAHICPRDAQGSAQDYLQMLAQELLVQVRQHKLAERVDIFVEEGAFTPEIARPYLEAAKAMGFGLTVHADQFSVGGSQLAIDCGAQSADHLEVSEPTQIQALAQSEVVATALPGASLGLGCAFTPGRALLDAGACLAIASDYNPGSAPMGDLLTQAAIYGAVAKLRGAEVWAGMTLRAARALGLQDRGELCAHKRADFQVFDTHDYREILYHQGQLGPSCVWVGGQATSIAP